MADHTSRRLPLAVLSFGFGLAAILGAWGFQIFGGYSPCKLCLEQRIPYYLGLPVLLVAILLLAARKSTGLARALLVLAGVIFLVGLGLGIYHAGVEWKFWLGPADCGGGLTTTSNAGDLLAQVNKTKVVSCTDAALRPILLRQYREQRGQATMLAAGLLRCGPAARTFLDSGAFDATHALIDFIIGAAGDMPAYVGCCALSQAPAAVRAASEIEAQFDALAQRYPSAAEGFAAVGAHARQDASVCGGTPLLAQWVEEAGEPDAASRLRMLRGAHGVAAAYRVMFDTLHRLDDEI
ncbi:MAG: disulfide bond formation protein B [Pandoraea sp.]|nr:disulfide bond formation protein B [Pandoraea sp.]